ncbi:MAG: hypothetical protein ACREVX_14705, partial [Clostridium sp.]|uniref:hypothetical protein n=1 Tax=Clostridium sp. TaxID=1506 RepID=UPI003D6CB36F
CSTFPLLLPSDPTVASSALALRLSSRWLGDVGFFLPIGSANMMDVQNAMVHLGTTAFSSFSMERLIKVKSSPAELKYR